MPSMTTTYTFTNGNVIDSLQMNTNFNDVKAAFNTNAVQVDGSVKATEASLNDGIVTSAKIANDTIVNADINSAAGIVDTKLATIATAGKVSNSATTATSANTASAIVARDGSGNFTAGTVTANLTGNVTGNVTGNLTGTASGNLVSGGALGTPSSGTLANCTFPTLNQNTTGNAATATNATNATTAANLTGFAKGTVVTTFTNVSAGGRNRMLVAFAHGLGGQPSGAAVYNGDHAAMQGNFVVYSVDASNITVEALDYGSSFISITGRIYWMAYR